LLARLTALVVLLVALVAGSTPANAITDGSLDGNGHPYVGLMVAKAADDTPLWRCSGTLTTVLLTAGHVTQDWEQAGLRARVTFDPVRSDASVWHTGTVHTNPGYDPQRANDSGDLGVVVFDAPVTGIAPALLPTAGLLDALGPRGLKNATFDVVGYGVRRFLGGANGGGQPHPDRGSGGTRMVASQTFNSLTSSWMRLQQHENGSICFGDSGSPSLFSGTNRIATMTVGVFGQCENIAWNQRIDTASARAFLSHYVALP